MFAVKNGNESNGCFIISTSSMIWHCSDRKQRKKINLPEGFCKLQSKNIEFECRYTPLECLIDFYVNDKFLISLKDVRPFKSQYLTPCIIFLKNCEVQTTFDYWNREKNKLLIFFPLAKDNFICFYEKI